MGLQDRDYSRDHSQGYGGSWSGQSGGGTSWGNSSSTFMGGGGVRTITVTLIIVNVVLFFADLVLSGGGDVARSVMADWFAVRGDTIAKPWTWYRFLSYGFVHSTADIRHLAFNMLGLFIFGRAVESRMGRSEYLRFYLVAVVIGGLVASLTATLPALAQGDGLPAGSTIGASGAVMAVTILFAFYFPHATILLMLVFPVKAWVLAVVYVVMNILGVLGGGGGIAYGVHLAGVGFAAVYHLRSWRLDFLRLDALSTLIDFFSRRKPNLKLHDPEKKLAKQEAEVDRILDKIQVSGIDSLSASERKTLERHSRLKRQQRS